MKIETKLGFNDICFFIEDNKIKKGTIKRIEVIVKQGSYCFGGETSISYYVQRRGSSCVLREDSVFKTLEETLKYLEENVE